MHDCTYIWPSLLPLVRNSVLSLGDELGLLRPYPTVQPKLYRCYAGLVHRACTLAGAFDWVFPHACVLGGLGCCAGAFGCVLVQNCGMSDGVKSVANACGCAYACLYQGEACWSLSTALWSRCVYWCAGEGTSERVLHLCRCSRVIVGVGERWCPLAQVGTFCGLLEGVCVCCKECSCPIQLGQLYLCCVCLCTCACSQQRWVPLMSPHAESCATCPGVCGHAAHSRRLVTVVGVFSMVCAGDPCCHDTSYPSTDAMLCACFGILINRTQQHKT